MLDPLAQFVCDNCHETIEPGQGRLEWLEADRKAHGFRIVHHQDSCRLAPHRQDLRDLPLDQVIGPENLLNLYRIVSVEAGPGDGPGPALAENMDEFTELLRRLTMRYYEEARLYWRDAEANGFFASASDAEVYHPATLKALVQSYGRGDGQAGKAGRCGCC